MSYGNIHLTPQLVQAVRDAVEIEAIAGEHTPLKKTGRRLKGLCPLHKEKTPSFSVDPDQGLFYCFGCGRGGDAIKLHMLLSGDDFPGAIESLARRYGIPLPTRSSQGSRVDRKLERIEAALERAEGFFHRQLERAEMPRAYLAERRIPPELIEDFRIGYAPEGWDNLLGEMHPEVPLEDLVDAGLVGRSEKSGKPYDRFRNRLIFPIRNAAGRLVGFGGRAMDDDKAKYINTAETDRFHKGRLLYGLDRAKRSVRDSGRALLVEGYFDVIGSVAAGIPWAVASMGTALTPEQARLLARYADEVVVGYDGDDAGERAFRRVLPLILEQGLGAFRLRLGGGQDPDSLRLEEGSDALVGSVQDAPDAVLLELGRRIPSDVHRDPQRRATAARSVEQLLEPIPDGILRYSYGRQAADRLGVPVELLWRRLGVDKESLKGPPSESSGPKEVQGLEERLLQLVLTEPANVPPLEELPPAEAFHDASCRNIFAAFLALYSQNAAPPGAREVRDALGGESEAVDQLARILLENSVSSGENELPEAIRHIDLRWAKQRLRELPPEIQRADREGDSVRLEQLLDEKKALSAKVHGVAEAGRRTGEPS